MYSFSLISLLKIATLIAFSWLNFALKKSCTVSLCLSNCPQNTASEVVIFKKTLINSCPLQARLPVRTTCDKKSLAQPIVSLFPGYRTAFSHTLKGNHFKDLKKYVEYVVSNQILYAWWILNMLMAFLLMGIFIFWK